MRKDTIIWIAALAVVGALAPFALRSPHWLQVLSMACYYALLASSWNLMLGYTGLFSFAHTALAAIGGYASALLVVKAGLPPAFAIPVGGVAAAVASLVLGVVSLPLRGFYLCLVTWAFAEIITGVFRVEYQVTGGTMGLMVPGLFPTGAPKELTYFVGLALVIAVLVFMVLLSRSRIGIYLRSIRDDELASEVMGVNTTAWKVFCFIVSGFWAGLGGAYYGHLVGVVDPTMGSLGEMGLVILMVIIGGSATVPGPVLGAIVVVILSEYLRGSLGALNLAAMSMLIFAIVMILVMRFFPGGIVGGLRRLRQIRPATPRQPTVSAG